MIGFMTALPGHIVALATAHPFLFTLLVMIVAAVGYGVLVKVKFSADDRRDERANRKHYLR